jgi:hypothetical protein
VAVRGDLSGKVGNPIEDAAIPENINVTAISQVDKCAASGSGKVAANASSSD